MSRRHTSSRLRIAGSVCGSSRIASPGGETHFTGGLADLAAFAAWLARLRAQAWVVYCKPPFAGPAHVLAYLGRYTHRVAISTDRLVALEPREVRFCWRDYARHTIHGGVRSPPDRHKSRFSAFTFVTEPLAFLSQRGLSPASFRLYQIVGNDNIGSMPHIALLGAGFSRNWGGWLAPEAFEYFLGCPQVDEDIRNLLWLYKRKGGFEEALAQLQAAFAQRRDAFTEQRLAKMQKAVLQMLDDMDKAFTTITDFEPQNEERYLVRSFLVRFDAIFTLNQDLLMERHYLNDNVALSSDRRWNGWEIPGMQAMLGAGSRDAAATKWSPTAASKFAVSGNLQPYFKLHGSSNWFDDSSGAQLLVMGGNKPSTIYQHPILKWNYDQFREYLSRPSTRLMIIGYSFGDDHINRVIGDAAKQGGLRLFIIDLLGVDVLDKNRHVPVYSPDPLFARLQPFLMGASRRTVREIFGTDRVEHGKVMRFFSSS